jgi:hypothetical protein
LQTAPLQLVCPSQALIVTVTVSKSPLATVNVPGFPVPHAETSDGYKLVPPQIAAPPFPVLIVTPSSRHSINAGGILDADPLKAASRAFCLAEFKLTNTIDAKIPMMAITIKSSISVKPRIILFFIFSPAFLDI